MVSSFKNPWAVWFGRRAARFLISILVLVSASFAMIHLIPGDPVRLSLGYQAQEELVVATRHALGLDEPLAAQYFEYLVGVADGRLGTSLILHLPVSEIISERMAATLALAASALATVLLIAVPIGLWTAAATWGGRHRGVELAFASSTGLFTALPDFLLGTALVFVFAVQLAWLPVAGNAAWESYVLPVLALALGPATALARVVRVEGLRVLSTDYIRTARAKRLPWHLLYLRHVLPNVLTAILTYASLLFGALIAGTVLVENVFAWPGIGQTVVHATVNKDYPLVQGLVLAYGSIILFLNLVVDTVLGIIDPRSTITKA